jgi:serine/threonine protein kinase
VQDNGSIYGQYHVIDRIAVGGMAEIYLGIAHGVEGFERQVVIKKVRQRFSSDSRFHSMLVKEAKICASLNHPNIVQILDLGQNDTEEYFIVMEYVDGWDLRSIMDRLEERGEQLDWDLVFYVAREICAALDYAHQKTDPNGKPLRLIHRDVSPSNILISRSGQVKLADFGIARYGRDVSVVGSLKGKLAYMSPEQARSELLDHRTDLFSLGAVMYENLCGRRVFDAESDIELLEQVRIGRIAPPRALDPSLPENLERLLQRALHTDPEARFRSAEEMAAAITSFQFANSSKQVTPEQLAAVLEMLFPETGGGSRPEPAVPVFTITTKVELREPVFAEQYASSDVEPLPAGPAADRSTPSFLEVVTEPGRPPAQLLAELKRTEQDEWSSAPRDTQENPLDAINTDAQYPPLLDAPDRTLEDAITPAKRRRPTLPTFRPEDVGSDQQVEAEAQRDVLEDARTEVADVAPRPGLDTMRRQLLGNGKRPVFSEPSPGQGGERPIAAPVRPRDTDARPTEPQQAVIEDKDGLSSQPTHLLNKPSSLDKTPIVEEAGPPTSVVKQEVKDKTPIVEPADPPTQVVLEKRAAEDAPTSVVARLEPEDAPTSVATRLEPEPEDAPTSVATRLEPEHAPTSVATRPEPEDAPTTLAPRREEEDAPTRVVKDKERPAPEPELQKTVGDLDELADQVAGDKALMAAMAAMADQPTKILDTDEGPARDEPVPSALEAQSTFVIKKNDSSPFAKVVTEPEIKEAQPKRKRSWGAWLMVAIFGLSIGGGAALLLLMPQSPFHIFKNGEGEAPEKKTAKAEQPRPVGKRVKETTQAVSADAASAKKPPKTALKTKDAGTKPAKEAPEKKKDASVKLAAAKKAKTPKRKKKKKKQKDGYYTGVLKDRPSEKPEELERPKPERPQPKTVTLRKPDPEPPERPRRRHLVGSVVIKSDPWAYIHVDGRNTKRTTSAQAFTLPAGRHRIELVNPALDLRKTITIDVPPEGLVRRFVRLR